MNLVEDFLITSSGDGFTDREAGGAYRSFNSFLLGQRLPESEVREAQVASGEERPRDGGLPQSCGSVDPDANPTLSRCQGAAQR